MENTALLPCNCLHKSFTAYPPHLRQFVNDKLPSFTNRLLYLPLVIYGSFTVHLRKNPCHLSFTPPLGGKRVNEGRGV